MRFTIEIIAGAIVILTAIVYVVFQVDYDRRRNARFAIDAERVIAALYGARPGWEDWRNEYGHTPVEDVDRLARPDATAERDAVDDHDNGGPIYMPSRRSDPAAPEPDAAASPSGAAAAKSAATSPGKSRGQLTADDRSAGQVSKS
jgi:hypothetical protein